MIKFLKITLILVIYNAVFALGQETIPVPKLKSSQGTIKISESGGFTYTKSIQVVPGTSGTQPNLQISYSHQGSSGYMGVGWNIAGMSSISRVPRSKYLEENSFLNSLGNKINFNRKDRYSLDGQQLVLAKENIKETLEIDLNASYGLPNTNYFAETTDFSQVTISDTLHGSPTKFIVKTKSGLTMEYGGSEDSKIEAQGSLIPIHWLINKITDSKGNFMTYTYYEDNAIGEFYPIRIAYTGNEKANLLPYAAISFTYNDLINPIIRYSHGHKQTQTKILYSIQCLSGETAIRSYRFTYEEDTHNTNRYLVKIQETVNDELLDPVIFTWDTFNQVELGEINVFDYRLIRSDPETNSSKPRLVFFGDWNGDGLQDMLLHILKADYKVPIFYLTEREPFQKMVYYQPLTDQEFDEYKPRSAIFDPRLTESPFDSPPPVKDFTESQFLAVDFNADGKTDLIWYRPEDGEYCFYLNDSENNKIHFVKQNPGNVGKVFFRNHNYQIIAKDFNTDGLTDLIFYNKNGDQYKKIHFLKTRAPEKQKINGSSLEFYTFDSVNWTIKKAGGWDVPISKSDTSKIFFEDLDQDGFTDVLTVNESKPSLINSQNLENGNVKIFAQKNYESIISHDIQYTHEFDIDSIGITPFEVPIEISNGSIVKNYEDIFLQDFNGDGLIDILIYAIDNQEPLLSIYVNKGSLNFEKLGNAPFENAGLENLMTKTINKKLHLADINFDGRIDIVFPAVDRHYVLYNKGNFEFSKLETTALINYEEDFSRQSFGYVNDGTSYIFYYDYYFGINFYKKLKISGTNIYGIDEANINYSAKYSTTLDHNVLGMDINQSSTYPLINARPPVSLVKELFMQTGLASNNIQYSYKGSVIDLRGKGFKGFREVSTLDFGKGRREVKKYSYYDDFRLDGLTSIEIQNSDSTTLSKTDFARDFVSDGISKKYYGFIRQSITTVFDPTNGSPLESTTTREQRDDVGNVIYLVTDYGSGIMDSIVNSYNDNKTLWYLGRLIKATMYKIKMGQAIRSNSAGFLYDINSGLLVSEITNSESVNEQLKLTKNYQYDIFGNIIESSITGWNGQKWETRTVKSFFDDSGRFPLAVINSLGHIIRKIYDSDNGNVQISIDPNNLITYYDYDKLGRLIKETAPDKNWASFDTYVYDQRYFSSPFECKQNCSPFSVPLISYVVYKQSSLGRPTIEYYEALGRNIGTRKTGPGGIYLNEYSWPSFTSNSEVISQSNIFSDTEKSNLTYYKYDKYQRHAGTQYSINSSDTIIYEGKFTTYRNAASQQKIVETDYLGQIISVKDNNGKLLKYDYDAYGNIVKCTDPKGNIIENEYDSRGLRIKTFDPNMGTYEYSYNGFGELIKQTNPDGKLTTFEYDNLGRLIKENSSDGVTVWTFDVGIGASIGNITKINYSNGDIEVNYTRDSLGRTISETNIIAGKSYTTIYEYDSKSRIAKYTYPSKFAISYDYDSDGYLSQIRRSSDNQILWRANGYYSNGKIKLEEYGNGLLTNYKYQAETFQLSHIEVSSGSKILSDLQYEHDKIGNLSKRSDLVRQLSESFEYDNLNRLTRTNVNGIGDVTIEYDELGNIIYKSDVGRYDYGSTNNGSQQIQSITPTNDSNQLVCIPSLSISTEFTSFNKVKKISNDTSYVEISYGTNKQRVIQKMYINNILVRTKIYVGQNFEIEVTSNETKQLHYLRGGNGVFGMFIQADQSKSGIQYWHKDNLGSLSMISDEDGKIISEFSYDAWGRRRNLDWSAHSTVPAIPNMYNSRGFTTHEHYDLFDMIDMNGRVYDAVLGRFLSPDPNVQDISNLQSLNRYSYVGNNPLTYTDPSGYLRIGPIHFPNPFNSIKDAIKYVAAPLVGIAVFSDWAWEKSSKWIKENWKTVVVVAVVVGASVLTGGALGVAFAAGGPYALWGAVIAGGVGGFAGGVTGTLLNGGSIGESLKEGAKGAAIGAASAGLTFGVGSAGDEISKGAISFTSASLPVKVLGHGIVQGATAKVQGGKFLHGFYSGALTGGFEPINAKLSTDASKIASSAVLGGTTAEISGGKFANGAITGAYVYLFNQDMHQREIDIESETTNNAAMVLDAATQFVPGGWGLENALKTQASPILAGLPGIVEGSRNLYKGNYTKAENAYTRAALSLTVSSVVGSAATALAASALVAVFPPATVAIIAGAYGIAVGLSVGILSDSFVNETLVPKNP